MARLVTATIIFGILAIAVITFIVLGPARLIGPLAKAVIGENPFEVIEPVADINDDSPLVKTMQDVQEDLERCIRITPPVGPGCACDIRFSIPEGIMVTVIMPSKTSKELLSKSMQETIKTNAKFIDSTAEKDTIITVTKEQFLSRFTENDGFLLARYIRTSEGEIKFLSYIRPIGYFSSEDKTIEPWLAKNDQNVLDCSGLPKKPCLIKEGFNTERLQIPFFKYIEPGKIIHLLNYNHVSDKTERISNIGFVAAPSVNDIDAENQGNLATKLFLQRSGTTLKTLFINYGEKVPYQEYQYNLERLPLCQAPTTQDIQQANEFMYTIRDIVATCGGGFCGTTCQLIKGETCQAFATLPQDFRLSFDTQKKKLYAHWKDAYISEGVSIEKYHGCHTELNNPSQQKTRSTKVTFPQETVFIMGTTVNNEICLTPYDETGKEQWLKERFGQAVQNVLTEHTLLL